MGLPPRAWTAICVGTIATWIALNILDAVSGAYAVDPSINYVAGSVFGATGVGAYVGGRNRSNNADS